MSDTYTNALIHETSPYLLQHARNPVDWHPWNEATLAKAKKENKLLLISIGYSACHWCHVMEHESFEKKEVADLMNSIFLPIKVDREERPDVDDLYMAACQYTRGTGGWPLNAIALPDGRPIWSGTYYSKEQWMDILKQFIRIHKEEYHKLEATADHLVTGIQQAQLLSNPQASDPITDSYHRVTEGLLSSGDYIYGGRSGAPKFPMPHNWMYLLHYVSLFPNKKAEKLLRITLDRMADGGIYDHVGGGFARYSVDQRWLVPHFEKMLYDNGQLLSLYSKAYQIYQEPKYRDTALGIMQHIEQDLWAEDGIHAAIDADSEGIEGKYYVWSHSELTHILQNHAHASYLTALFMITPQGNWEGNTIISRSSVENLHEAYDLTQEEARKVAKDFLDLLHTTRKKRIAPAIDTKIITSWNALTIIGYLDAYIALEDPSILDKGLALLDRLLDRTLEEDTLYRIRTQQTSILGFLDDYALTIAALIRAYEVSLKNTYLATAQYLTDATLSKFSGTEKGLLYYTRKDNQELVTRRYEKEDNVIPSSNSVMATNLYKLGKLYENSEYLAYYGLMMKAIHPFMATAQYANYYSNWAIAGLYQLADTEVICMGEGAVRSLQNFQKNTCHPVVFGGNTTSEILPVEKYRFDEDETLFYVCRRKSCLPPTEDTDEALNLIKNDIS